MTLIHRIHSLEHAEGFLAGCALYLQQRALLEGGRPLTLSPRACQEIGDTLQRVASLIGERVAEDTAGRSADLLYGDLMAFAATGGPPPLPPRAFAVPLPGAGDNVVALVPALVRPDTPR